MQIVGNENENRRLIPESCELVFLKRLRTTADRYMLVGDLL